MTPDFLSGGGCAGAALRAVDWSATPLGAPETWPQALRTVVGILQTSRFAMWMGWGEDLTFFYNDAYAPTLGVKHPWAMGKPVREVWAEIWHDLAPRIDIVRERGEATWDEALQLFLERSGFPEETYHTFSYSPLKDEHDVVEGLLCVVSEVTDRVIGERRLAMLGDLAAGLAGSQTEREVLDEVAERIGANDRDLPFTLIYLFDDAGQTAYLASSTGFAAGHPAAPATIVVGAADAVWPAQAMLDAGGSVNANDIASRFSDLPRGAWQVPPREALVVPIARQAQSQPAGFMVAGLNPFRLLDAAYRDFVGLVAGQIAAGIANARGFEAERRRAEALAEIDRAKTAFFSNVSHEFRTPLTLMLSPIEDLLASQDDAAARPMLEMAHRNALRLLKLVNSLLDFSRIEAGRAQAVFEPVDLATFTAELASSFRSVLDRAGLAFEVTCVALPEPVYVDRDMWEKVVLNLLSNAFKFTFEGGVAVAVRPSQDGASALVSVTDTGTGIPEAQLPRLFERFHRIEGARGRTFEGSGIGLALVQELVKLHGASISVHSELDRGTTFTIAVRFGTAHLPQDRVRATRSLASTAVKAEAYVEEAARWLDDDISHADRALDDVAAAPAEAGVRRSIVLADDNADMRGYVERLLGTRYELTSTADGAAALAAVRARKPDLVLSDVMMPRLDGFGLLRAIRADPALRDVPVILLSARAGEEARVEGLEVGADDYLAKPFAARELLARIAANLALAQVRRESAAQLQLALDAGDLGSFWIDLTAGVGGWSHRAARIFGLSPDDPSLTVAAWHNTLHPEDRARVLAAHERVLTDGVPMREEFRVLWPSGETRWVRAEALLRRDPSHRAVQVAGVMRDITAERRAAEALQKINEQLELRVSERTRELADSNNMLTAQIAEREQVEETLRQMQRLEAVGQLTSGVAHDFNNLLTVVLGSVEFLQRNPTLPGQDRRIEMIRNAAERGANLTAQLLAFSRRQRLEPKPLDLNGVVAGMIDLLRSTLGGTVRLETTLDPDLWPALVDQTQIELVILNLAINARDAMPNGGSLTVATSNAEIDAPMSHTARARRPEEPGEGSYVAITVADTGTGMAPEVLARVFEPFFTTKGVGKGSGLGLAQVYGFAKQSGGGVRIETQVGEGTRVSVFLPRATAGLSDADRVPSADGRPAVPGGRLRVLLVDDDAMVRDVTETMLDDLGYDVTAVSDGLAALDVLGTNPDIALLLIDFAMPQMNGAEVARRARAIRPELPVLFITGFADTSALGEVGEDIIVGKPFRNDELRHKLAAALEAPPAARAAAVRASL